MPKLAELVKAVPQSRLLGDEKTMSLEFTSVSTDSRSLTPGALFFALSGPHFDGEEFIEAAQRRGAIAAVVTAKRLDELQMKALRQESRLPQIEVPDPLLALQQWAHYWRQNWLGRVIAVTGSNGKTTVKQMLAAIGGQALRGASVWATPGNLNNHIGLPLSVLGLQPQHRLAIFELGMNHPGEINILAAIACAQIALVNNAQREHQEFMHSVAAVAQENGSVLQALGPQGVAVFPADDPHTPLWREWAGARPCWVFGADPSAQVSLAQARWKADHWQVRLHTPLGDLATELHIAGQHNVRNAMAATAAAMAAGAPVAAVAQGLRAFQPVNGRSRAFVTQGLHQACTVVDDTYNANPDSVLAAIDVLAELPAPRLLVLGDMGEVGAQGEVFHTEVGQHAKQRGIERLFTLGTLAQASARAHPSAQHFEDMAGLQAAVRALAPHCGSVLVKGSRFMRMERVIECLLTPSLPTEAACS